MDGGAPEPQPRARSDSGGELSHTLPASDTGSTTTASDAVNRKDLSARYRSFAWMTVLLVVLGVGLILFAGGDPLARQLLVAAAAFTLLCYGLLLLAARRSTWNAERYAEHMGWLAFGPTAAALYYFGIVSPYAAVATIGVFLYARVSGRTRFAVGALLAAAVPHAALAIAMIADWIDDPALISSETLPLATQVVAVVGALALYGIAFALGRGYRAQSLRTAEELERVVRAATRQEAMLDEARQEALAAGGVGGPGPFSDRVLGSFRLGRIIGRGAMGEVYTARHVESDAEAAVKVLHRHLLGDADRVSRFAREAVMAFRLESPHIVRVLESADDDAPVPYIAMELLRGEDLAARLRTRGVLPLEDVVELASQIATGLQEARVRGVVHRDLKPHNVFATGSGRAVTWKILDFGVSKMLDQEVTLTHGGVIGTPAYMAPEQATGRPIDHRADIHALAAICYRALAGRPPFTGAEVMAVLYEVAESMPPRPTELCDFIPDGVDSVLAIGLAKDPRLRYDAAPELAAALAAAADGTLDDGYAKRARAVLERWPWKPL